MTELTCFNRKYSKKTRKLSKNNRFVTNKTKFVYFLTVLSFFMKLRLNFQFIVFISHVLLSENLFKRLKNDTTQILSLF